MKGRASKRCSMTLVASGVLLASSALAQDQRVEVAAFLGGLSVTHDLGSAQNIFFTQTGEADDVSFGDLFGFRVAFNFTRYIGVEGSYSRAENSFLFSVDDRELGMVDLGSSLDADLESFSVNAVVQVPLESGLVPYGTVGFGRQQTDLKGRLSDLSLENNDGSGANFGGGIKYFFPGADWIGARFDVRYQLIDRGIAFSDFTEEPRNTEFTVGASLRF